VNKRTWINIGLIGLIVLLTIYINTSDQDKEPEVIRVSNIEQNNIVQIKVLRKDLDDFEFNKNNNIWSLDRPQQFIANSARINAMLRILKAESFAQLNPEEVDLDQLGLSEPNVVMKLNDYEFKFGNTDAIDQRRYVLFDKTIYLTNDFLYQQLMTNAAFFANPKLIPENFLIESIQFPENKISQIDGVWKLEKLMDISPDQLKRIIFNWNNAVAISAEQYQPADNNESIIKITSTDHKSILFLLISNDPHLVLARKDLGIQFHMGSDETNKLLLIEGADPSQEAEPVGLELH
jgi:uncharacterized protein DUF4340